MSDNEKLIVEVDENDVPAIIQEQFDGLKIYRENVQTALDKADKAHGSAEAAKNKKTGMFKNKAAIEALQSTTGDIADAVMANADAQKVFLDYQQKLGEVMKYLLGLGVSNMALNRSVVRELELKLSGASEEELDELARQEIVGVVKQLKAQEDIMRKQNDLSDIVHEHDQMLQEHEKKAVEHDNLFSKKNKKDQSQDEELKRQSDKDKEHDKRLDEKDRIDKNQDEEIKRQKEKDKEHDDKLEQLTNDLKKANETIDELARKHKESNEVIEGLKGRCEELEKAISLKANNAIALGALIVSIIALAIAIAQFFI